MRRTDNGRVIKVRMVTQILQKSGQRGGPGEQMTLDFLLEEDGVHLYQKQRWMAFEVTFVLQCLNHDR